MKKFMSMLMLVLLTITVSACERKKTTLDADFTFETTISKNEDEKTNRSSISGDLTATNNTNYYITNYPIVAFPVDEKGNPLGSAYKSTNITMAPNATVVYPFDIYFEDLESVASNIKVLPVDWEICQSIVNKTNEDSKLYNKNHNNPGDEEFLIPMVDIDEAHFQQRINDAVTTEPKNLVYYGMNPATTECKYVKSKESNYYSLQLNIVNNEDYDFRLNSVAGLLTYKQGDKIVKQTWIWQSHLNSQVYLKPGEETMYANRYGTGGQYNDEGYTMEFTLLPNLEGITK